MILKSRFVIAVPDLAISSDFYQDVLGFEIHRIADPGWRFYVRDDCVIMAGECADAIPPRELGDHSYFAYLVVDRLSDMYDKVLAEGVEIVKPLQHEPWGMREFGLRTVDGHRIMFGEPAAPA